MQAAKLIYKLKVKDVQEVAIETLNRTLTVAEINLISDTIADNIPWFDAIEGAIMQHKLKEKKE